MLRFAFSSSTKYVGNPCAGSTLFRFLHTKKPGKTNEQQIISAKPTKSDVAELEFLHDCSMKQGMTGQNDPPPSGEEIMWFPADYDDGDIASILLAGGRSGTRYKKIDPVVSKNQ